MKRIMLFVVAALSAVFSGSAVAQSSETTVRWTEEDVTARLANPDASIASTAQRLPPTRENISRLAEDIFGMRTGDLFTEQVGRALRIDKGWREDHTQVFDATEKYAARHGRRWKQVVRYVNPLVNPFGGKETWVAIKEDVEMIVAFGATYAEQAKFNPAIYAAIAKLVEERIDCSQVQKVCKEDKSYGIYKRAWLFPMGESKWRERNYIVLTLDGLKGRTTFRIDDFSLENISPGDMEMRTVSRPMMHEQAKECGLSDSFLTLAVDIKMESGKRVPTAKSNLPVEEVTRPPLVLTGIQNAKGLMVARDNGTAFVYHRLAKGNQMETASCKCGPYGEDGICITACVRDDWHNYIGEIVFPSRIDNLPVLFIGEGNEKNRNGFANGDIFFPGKNMANYRGQSQSHSLLIYIPDGVVEIGRIGRPHWHSDFHSRPPVTVVLPKSLKRIGVKAFYDVSDLSVRLPEGLMSIGNEAFLGSGLKSINIPASVESFGYDCLGSTPNLISIELPENPGFYLGRVLSKTGWWENLVADGEIKYGNRLIKYNGAVPPDLVISDGTTSIDADVFANNDQLISVKIPDSVRWIGCRAFSSCKNLKKVVLPATAGLVIAAGAFEECSALAELSAIKSASRIDADAFMHCKSLPSVEIAGETHVAPNAFAHCHGLKSVVIDGRAHLAAKSFLNCRTLSKLTLRGGVEVEGYAFNACSEIEDIELDENVRLGHNAIDVRGSPYWNKQPDGLVCLGDAVFGTKGNCPSAVVFPENIKRIVGAVDLKNAKTVVFPEDLEEFCPRACSRCGAVEIEIPEKVKVIPQSAFWNSSFTKIEFAGVPESIGKEAFANCEKLAELALPDGVNTIGEAAFRGCTGMDRLKIGKGCTSIGKDAFKRCSSLTDVELPGSLAELDGTAFEECSAMLRLTTPIIGGKLFGACFPNSGKVENVTICDGCESIPSNYFVGQKSIKHIVIPPSVKKIGSGVFMGCDSLQTVTFLGDAPAEVSSSAFKGTPNSMVIKANRESKGWPTGTSEQWPASGRFRRAVETGYVKAQSATTSPKTAGDFAGFVFGKPFKIDPTLGSVELMGLGIYESQCAQKSWSKLETPFFGATKVKCFGGKKSGNLYQLSFPIEPPGMSDWTDEQLAGLYRQTVDQIAEAYKVPPTESDGAYKTAAFRLGDVSITVSVGMFKGKPRPQTIAKIDITDERIAKRIKTQEPLFDFQAH